MTRHAPWWALLVLGVADVSRAFVDELCANGETVEFLLLDGVNHVEAGHLAAPDVAEWIAARFAGEPAPTACT